MSAESEAGNDDDDEIGDVANARSQHPELFLLQLRAANDAAQRVFAELMDLVRRQPPDPTLARVRLRFDTTTMPAARWYSPSSSASSDLPPDPAPHLGGGSYLISLGHPPLFPTLGWSIGRGTPSRPHRGVDIVLPESKRWRVHTSHASITFAEHGCLCLRAHHSGVQVNGHHVPSGTHYALPQRQNRITLGLLELHCDFIGNEDASEEQHAHAKAAFLRRHRPELGNPHPLVSATPSDQDSFLGGTQWKVHGVVGIGGIQEQAGRTIIDAVTHIETGKVYALKTRERFNQQTARAVQLEVEQYTRLDAVLAKSKDNGAGRHVARMHTVLWPAQRVWASGLKDRVHLIYEPLCFADFTSLLRSPPDELSDQETLLALVYQVLQGLNFLHSHDIVHRDIKPGNLAYVLSVPPRAVIIDLQTIIFLSDYPSKVAPPQPGSCGTIGYLAPELENAFFCDEDLEGYTTQVDIWALGKVCLQIFPWLLASADHWQSQPNPFREPTIEAEVARYKSAVSSLIRDPHSRGPRATQLSCLVGKMLLWAPESRPSADVLLLDRIFNNLPREWRPREPSPQPGEKRRGGDLPKV